MRIVITGAAGMLGSALMRSLSPNHETVAVVHRTPLPEDLAGAVEIRWDLASEPPPELSEPADIWIHCAAFTSVDGAERDPDTARRVNVDGTRAVADLAAGSGSRLVYVSTDSVFDGRRGHYAEDDVPAPVNEYARSKLMGEEIVRDHARGLVVRTNLVAPDGGLVEWLLERARSGEVVPLFRDVVFNPVPVSAFPTLVLQALDGVNGGTIHLGSIEVMSKAHFGRLVLAHAGHADIAIEEMRIADRDLEAPRPLDTSLCTLKARRLGLTLPSIDTLLDALNPREQSP